MALNLSELRQLRTEKREQIKDTIETRDENPDEASIALVTSLKAEIKGLDNKINMIEEYRQIAIENTKPEEVKNVDKAVELRGLFKEYMRGKISGKAFEKRAVLISTNGSVIPDAFLKELQETIKEYGIISPACRHITTEDNGQLSIPVINDTANSGQWTAEAGAITKADFATSSITLDAHKVTTGIQVSAELIEDSFFDLESYLAQAFGTRLARTMEDAYMYGDGTGKPTGIVNTTGTKSHTSKLAGNVHSSDIIEAIFKLQPSSRAGAIIYVSDDLMKDLTLEVDADDRPLLQPQAGATPADPIKTTISGYEVKVNYHLELVVAASTSCVIGNPRNYMIRDVRNVKFTRDEYTDMGTDMVNFYATARVDGAVVSANDAFVKIITAS